nr:hypothetical protein CFP56_22399 [Quercus suber]
MAGSVHGSLGGRIWTSARGLVHDTFTSPGFGDELRHPCLSQKQPAQSLGEARSARSESATVRVPAQSNNRFRMKTKNAAVLEREFDQFARPQTSGKCFAVYEDEGKARPDSRVPEAVPLNDEPQDWLSVQQPSAPGLHLAQSPNQTESTATILDIEHGRIAAGMPRVEKENVKEALYELPVATPCITKAAERLALVREHLSSTTLISAWRSDMIAANQSTIHVCYTPSIQHLRDTRAYPPPPPPTRLEQTSGRARGKGVRTDELPDNCKYV